MFLFQFRALESEGKKKKIWGTASFINNECLSSFTAALLELSRPALEKYKKTAHLAPLAENNTLHLPELMKSLLWVSFCDIVFPLPFVT